MGIVSWVLYPLSSEPKEFPKNMWEDLYELNRPSSGANIKEKKNHLFLIFLSTSVAETHFQPLALYLCMPVALEPKLPSPGPQVSRQSLCGSEGFCHFVACCAGAAGRALLSSSPPLPAISCALGKLGHYPMNGAAEPSKDSCAYLVFMMADKADTQALWEEACHPMLDCPMRVQEGSLASSLNLK